MKRLEEDKKRVEKEREEIQKEKMAVMKEKMEIKKEKEDLNGRFEEDMRKKLIAGEEKNAKERKERQEEV